MSADRRVVPWSYSCLNAPQVFLHFALFLCVYLCECVHTSCVFTDLLSCVSVCECLHLGVAIGRGVGGAVLSAEWDLPDSKHEGTCQRRWYHQAHTHSTAPSSLRLSEIYISKSLWTTFSSKFPLNRRQPASFSSVTSQNVFNKTSICILYVICAGCSSWEWVRSSCYHKVPGWIPALPVVARRNVLVQDTEPSCSPGASLQPAAH